MSVLGTDAVRHRGNASKTAMHSILRCNGRDGSTKRRAKTGEWISMDVLSAIGNTSLVQLRKVVPPDCADIFAKLEWENPTGSIKDRMALAVISRAEESGLLKPGDTVI